MGFEDDKENSYTATTSKPTELNSSNTSRRSNRLLVALKEGLLHVAKNACAQAEKRLGQAHHETCVRGEIVGRKGEEMMRDGIREGGRKGKRCNHDQAHFVNEKRKATKNITE